MTKVITAFEAPALLDLHPTLTRYELFQRLTGQPKSIGPMGLSACLADGAMTFAQSEYGWSPPVQKSFEATSKDGALTLKARAYLTNDAQGPLLVVFLHLADYLHRLSWGKAGVPPQAFVAQANWCMALAHVERMAFLVLSDKRLVVYEVQRNEALVKQLFDATEAMAEAIATNTPPPIDAAPQAPAAVPAAAEADGPPADLNELVRRHRQAREAKAATANTATFAEQAAEAAAEALKKALPKGGSHEIDGYRTHHNAKTGRLTEEKIDGTYF